MRTIDEVSRELNKQHDVINDIDNFNPYPRVKTFYEIISEQHCTVINGKPIPVDMYAEISMVGKKKVRKRLLEKLRIKYRTIVKPLPMLNGDFDGDPIDIANSSPTWLDDIIQLSRPSFSLRSISINKNKLNEEER